MYQANTCCIDEEFTEKARNFGRSAALFPRRPGLLAGIYNWGREASWTDMISERLLALFRKSSPQHCFVDRILSSGFLAQLQRAHRLAGGKDGTKYTRRQLQDGDVPIRATATTRGRKQEKTTRRVQPRFATWANKQQRRERRAGERGTQRLGNRHDYRQRMLRVREE